MQLKIRLETPGDYRTVEEITRDAFWREGTDEHYLVHILRTCPDFIPVLDFVAETEEGEIVGNIMYSKAEIRSPEGDAIPVITFGPLTVAPAFQRRGVGQALMTRSIAEAKSLGYQAIVFFGHPDYYPRQGFSRGKVFGIRTEEGNDIDALMAMPLYEGALAGISGRFYESQIFQMNPLDVAAFEKGFPPKEPAQSHPIPAFLPKLGAPEQESLRENGIKTLEDFRRFSGAELLQLPGINRPILREINDALHQYGLPKKLFP